MRNELGRWLPGQTGNPKGRPRTGLSIAELCRGQVEKRNLIQKLGEIAARAGDYAKVEVDQQIRAIEMLVRHGYGLPGKTEIDGGEGVRIEVTYVERQQNNFLATPGAASGAAADNSGVETLQRLLPRPQSREDGAGDGPSDSSGAGRQADGMVLP
jgi:hypothetical protein